MKKFLLPVSIILVFVLAGAEGCKKKVPDACEDISCNSGGKCVDGTCQCDSVHEGTNCETEKRTKYFRSKVGAEDCTSRNHLDYLTVSGVADSAHQLNFHNLYGDEQDITGILLADGSVYIPAQLWYSKTISGTASLVNYKLVVNFSVDNDVCTWMEKW